MGEISIKPWPSGRASHATLAVIAGHRDATAITARVPPLIARLVGRPWRPDMTPAYARLCLPFLTALMLRDGRIDPRGFGPEAFGDPALQALGDRLTVIVDDNPDLNALVPQVVTVTTSAGAQAIEVPATLGSPANPLSPAALADKHDFAFSLAAVRMPASDPLALLSGTAA
jgi:2-methylcitrate dehydratase PrpD